MNISDGFIKQIKITEQTVNSRSAFLCRYRSERANGQPIHTRFHEIGKTEINAITCKEPRLLATTVINTEKARLDDKPLKISKRKLRERKFQVSYASYGIEIRYKRQYFWWFEYADDEVKQKIIGGRHTDYTVRKDLIRAMRQYILFRVAVAKKDLFDSRGSNGLT